MVGPRLSEFGEWSETEGESAIPKEREDARGRTWACRDEVAPAELREQSSMAGETEGYEVIRGKMGRN